MDAYIFCEEATSGAVSELAAGVGYDGPARLVLPLTGSHELYVAVEGEDSGALATKVSAVTGTDGVSGVSAYNASRPGGSFAFPTHALVDDFVGFALLTTVLATSVYESATGVTGVIGVAVVSGPTISVLVEATAGSQNALNTILSAVAGLPGVTSSVTASGPSSAGTGFES